MDRRPVNSEENDPLDGQDQSFSPFLQFETQEEQHNHEKRKE